MEQHAQHVTAGGRREATCVLCLENNYYLNKARKPYWTDQIQWTDGKTGKRRVR
jgi:hypothetical protein